MVKRIAAATCFALVLATSGCNKPPANWQPYTSAGGKYTVSFPGFPKEQSVPAAGTTVTAVLYEDSHGAFSVLHNDLPLGAKELTDPKVIDMCLNGGVQGALTNLKGTLISQEKSTMYGGPGVDFLLRSGDGKIYMRDKMFLVNGRLYQVMVGTGSAEGLKSPDAEKFFASFHLDK